MNFKNFSKELQVLNKRKLNTNIRDRRLSDRILVYLLYLLVLNTISVNLLETGNSIKNIWEEYKNFTVSDLQKDSNDSEYKKYIKGQFFWIP